MDKSITMIRAAGPWEYQQVQAMMPTSLYDEVYDPSPEAEARRIADRRNGLDKMEEELNAEEEAIIGDLFPGT